MRILSLAALFLIMVPAGARTASPRFTPPTERIPNADPVNAFPRWMGMQNPTIGWNSSGTISTTIGVTGRAMAIDSRNVVHTIEANMIARPGELTGPLVNIPSWAYLGTDHLDYKTDQLIRRRVSGFSAACTLENTYNSWFDGDTSSCELVHSPAIAVDATDRVHVAWVHTHWDAFNTLNRSSWIYYRIKGPSGWGAPVNLTSGDGGAKTYNSLQMKLGTDGSVHIVAVVGDQSTIQTGFYEDTGSWLSEIVYNGASSTITAIPGSMWAVGAPTYENDGPTAPRLALDSTNNPVVVWAQRYSAHDPGTGDATATYYQVYVNSKSGGAWGAAATFAEAASAGGVSNRFPDVALDASNNRYFVWTRSFGASTMNTGAPNFWWQVEDSGPGFWFSYPDNRFYFKSTSDPITQLASSTQVARGSIIFDSRGQLHTAWGTSNQGICYAARINNPGPGLNPTWRLQEPSGTGPASVYTMAISKTDQIHLSDGVAYTKTFEWGVDARDPAAMVGVVPHGAVNVSSGNFHYRLPFFSTTGVGPSMSVDLIYNSLDTNAAAMSPGWKLSALSYLIDHRTGEYTPGDTMTIFFGDGRPIQFGYNAALGYLTAPDQFGLSAKLERSALGNVTVEYRLTLKNGTLLRFNNLGWLWKVEVPNGNYLAMSFNVFVDAFGNNCFYPYAVTDMLGNGENTGRTMGIAWENIPTTGLYDPRISAVLDPNNRGYQLAYTGNNLTSVTFLGDSTFPVYTFGYPSGTPGPGERTGMPKTITMPRGNAWQLAYLPDGRFQSATAPSALYLLDSENDATAPTAHQAQVSLYFDETQAAATPRAALLTDARFYNTLYTVDTLRSLVTRIDDPSVIAGTPGITSVIRTFDSFGNLTDVQDRWGFHTTSTYFTTGNTPAFVRDNLKEVFRPNGSGSGQDLVASYTYTTDGFSNMATQTTRVTPTDGTGTVDRVTTYTYNGFGMLTQVLNPDVTRPDGTSQTNVTSTITYGGARYAVSRVVNEEGNGVTYSNFDSDTTFKTCLPKTVLSDGGTQVESRAYDKMGNLTSHTAPQGGPSNDSPMATTILLDGLYRLNVVTDPTGRQTIYNYDLDGNLTIVQPPAGAQTTTTYDARGLVSGGTTFDGGWSQVVDAAGNVKRSINERGFAANRTLDFLGRVTEARAQGASTLPAGQGGGGPAIHTTQFLPEGFTGTEHFSTVTEIGTPNRVTKATYDARGRAKEVLEADLATKYQTSYNELDQVVASQKLFNSTLQTCTVTFRDARDRVDRVRTQDVTYGTTPGINQKNSYTIYNKAGSVFQTVDPLGSPTAGGFAHKMTYIRDVRERVQHVIDGKGVIVAESVYGDDDRLIETKAPNPAAKTSTLTTTQTRTYTARKELKGQFDASGNGTTYTYYQPHGLLEKATDAAGQISRLYYDNGFHVTSSVEAEGTVDESRTFQTWTNGLLTGTQVYNPVTGIYDSTFTRTYDQAGRLERIVSPTVAQTQTAPERFFYNDLGQSSQHIAGTKTVTNTYNALGQNTQTQWTGAFSATTTRTYNGAGLPETISDGSKSKTTFYDVWKGTPSTESIAVGGGTWKVQTHTYDAAGNATGFGDAEGGQHGWPVDENNRPTHLEYGNQGLRQITYTPGGLVDKEILKSGGGGTIATTTHTYDTLGNRKGSQTVKAGTNEILTDYAWDHDTRHQITGIHLRHLGASFSMTVDGKGRTKTQSTPGNSNGNAAPPYTNQFGAAPTGNVSVPTEEASGIPHTVLPVAARSVTHNFHPSGNRTTSTVDGVTTTYTHNAANQLISESSSAKSVTHQYDQWGNETVRVTTPAGQSAVTETYGYNHLNMMSSYTNLATGANWQYDFYPTGERYAKTNLSTNISELYVSRDDDVATEYQKIGASPASLKNTYVQGLGIDQKQLRIALDGTRRHMLGDQVGTIGMTLDDTGGAVDTSVKDAWGVQIAGVTSERYGGVAQREIDTESGLVHMRHRMYDPLLGRFTQTDPILDRRASAHYVYASNRPVQNFDPTGRQDVELPSGKADEVWLPSDTGVDIAVAVMQRLAPFPDETTAAASGEAANPGKGWGPAARGKGRIFAAPADLGLAGKDFYDILKTSFVGTGEEKAEAVKFVRANAGKYFAEADTIFSAGVKDQRVVLLSHGSPTAIPLYEKTITDRWDFSTMNATFKDLTILGCGCGGKGGIAQKISDQVKKPVFGVNAATTNEKFVVYTNMGDNVKNRFLDLLTQLKDNKLNYFAFEQAWEKLYKGNNPKKGDYAYWHINVDNLKDFIRYPNK